MKGPTKTVVITGSNVGIGFAAAKRIAGLAEWHVVLACRNPSKAEEAANNIRDAQPGASVEFMPLDLFSLKTVRELAKTLADRPIPPLHGLVLNAGGINMKAKGLEYSEDGFERTFQLNFLGHFLLTNLLIEQLKAPARIVFVSSDLHDPEATRMGRFTPPRYGPVEEVAYAKGPYAKMSPMSRYGTAKMLAMMCAHELDRRLRSSGLVDCVTVNSWNPGVVPTTQAGRDMPALQKKIMMSPGFVSFMGSHLATDDEVGQQLGDLVTHPRFSSVSGRYFDGAREIPSSAESRDVEKARSVWDQAARLAEVPSPLAWCI